MLELHFSRKLLKATSETGTSLEMMKKQMLFRIITGEQLS